MHLDGCQSSRSIIAEFSSAPGGSGAFKLLLNTLVTGSLVSCWGAMTPERIFGPGLGPSAIPLRDDWTAASVSSYTRILYEAGEVNECDLTFFFMSESSTLR